MRSVPTTLTCDRVREWVSLEVDGELSEFESVLLNAHLSACADCVAYRADVTKITHALRHTALEAFTRPVGVPPRRRVVARAMPVVAAAAVVAVGLTGAFRDMASGLEPAAPVGQLESPKSTDAVYYELDMLLQRNGDEQSRGSSAL